jgi:hypothetical protein
MTTTTDTIAVSLAQLAAEAAHLTRLRDDAFDRSEYCAYGIALSMLHRLSGGAVGVTLQDQPGWHEREEKD